MGGVEYRILGPIEVLDDAGAAVPLAGSKQRALVGVLAVHAGSVVGTDHLIGELWGDDPPPTAANLLQGHVSKLRRVLPDPAALVSRAPGYQLVVPAGGLDAERFEQLVAAARGAGDPQTAARNYREALGLWRGPALGGAPLGPDGQAAAVRLDETRLGVVEEWISQELACGRHAELVGELEGLVAAHPFREGLRAQQMLALYRSGRQADALAAYRAARTFLDEELGCEPGAELRRLEQAVLRGDPSLHLPAGPVAAPPAEPATPAPPPGPAPARRRRTRLAALATAAAVAVIAIVTVALVVPGDSDSGTDAGPVVPGEALRYDFESGTPAEIVDVTGRGHDGRLIGDDPRSFDLVARDRGRAAQFPAPCTPTAGVNCPLVAIETPSAPDLNPEAGDFSFGADILITAADADIESNIMQKGNYGNGGSQWKLRLDDAQRGRAACVLIGVGDGQDPKRAFDPELELADGAWHRVSCHRIGDTLTLRVDGVDRRVVPLPPGLVVRNDSPVTIGSARVETNDDSRQYFGRLDDVFFTLG